MTMFSLCSLLVFLCFFNDTATTEIYTLSLHDALPINLSVDDRFLYASCWGTGEMRQYDVSDPFNPKLIGSVHVGGIVRRASHPAKPGEPLNGGPQMVEISRDGRRVYFPNSL